MISYKEIRFTEVFIIKREAIQTNQPFFFHREVVTKDTGAVTVRKHHHNFFEIYYITSGSCNYFIDSKSYQLMPGDIVIIPPGIIHNTEYQNIIHSRMLLYCPTRSVPASVRPMLPSMMYLYRNPSIEKEICHIFEGIEKEYLLGDTLSEDIICTYANMLFYLLARNINTCTPVKTGNEYIEQAIAYLQKNPCAQISLPDMAKMCSVSPAHFSRMFKKETGFGLCEYINLIRLQKAEYLLKTDAHFSITDIALGCGFNDSNYFSLKFKEMYGVSPKKYQLSSRNK